MPLDRPSPALLAPQSAQQHPSVGPALGAAAQASHAAAPPATPLGAAASAAAAPQPSQPSPPPVALPSLPLRGLKGNWEALWAAAARDHCHAGLVWNETTRGELRSALEREEAGLRARRLRVCPPWDPSCVTVRTQAYDGAPLGPHLV
jgi:DnaJ family protein C protein 13